MEAHQSVGVTIKICLMCWCAADANCEEFRAEAPPWLMEAVSFPIDIRLRQRGGEESTQLSADFADSFAQRVSK